jgi:hypothetical protein
MSFLIKRLTKGHIWRRIGIERIAEPLHLNIASALVAVFGSFRARVAFDLVVRHPLAFGLLQAADWARECGIGKITAIELGVANGAGLVNMCTIAAKVTKVTGISFEIVGFDSGGGMPQPKDFRDHPEFYGSGDFPMESREALQKRLPANATIVIGDVSDTIKPFLEDCAIIGFISVDLDYYHSTVEALKLLDAAPDKYLPWVVMYFDDVEYDRHNPFCGELAAIEEFNRKHSDRKIAKFNVLRQRRVFQRATWIDHMYIAHVFDHAFRTRERSQKAVLDNPFL